MYRRRSPRRGDCPLALCCMAFGLGVLLAIVVLGLPFTAGYCCRNPLH